MYKCIQVVSNRSLVQVCASCYSKSKDSPCSTLRFTHSSSSASSTPYSFSSPCPPLLPSFSLPSPFFFHRVNPWQNTTVEPKLPDPLPTFSPLLPHPFLLVLLFPSFFNQRITSSCQRVFKPSCRGVFEPSSRNFFEPSCTSVLNLLTVDFLTFMLDLLNLYVWFLKLHDYDFLSYFLNNLLSTPHCHSSRFSLSLPPLRSYSRCSLPSNLAAAVTPACASSVLIPYFPSTKITYIYIFIFIFFTFKTYLYIYIQRKREESFMFGVMLQIDVYFPELSLFKFSARTCRFNGFPLSELSFSVYSFQNSPFIVFPIQNYPFLILFFRCYLL